jgi:hypothetical protein
VVVVRLIGGAVDGFLEFASVYWISLKREVGEGEKC